MDWSNAFIFAFLVVNLATSLMIFYYINRNWETLIELKNHVSNLDKQIWRNTEQIAELKRLIEDK